MSDSTLVAIGCSYEDVGSYAAVVPLTALFWRDLIGHEPRIYLVGDESEWLSRQETAVVPEALRELGVAHSFIEHLGGQHDRNVAQNVRQHAAADQRIPDDTWIMASDADLWPLQREFYHQHVETDLRCVLLNANLDHFQGKAEVLRRALVGEPYQSLPTCHVIMRAATWREVYQYVTTDVATSMQWTLGRWLPRKLEVSRDPEFERWMSDQRIVTEKLCEQEWFPEFRLDDKNKEAVFRVGEVLFVTRYGHPPLNRLDRFYAGGDWKARPFEPFRWIDAHVHKNFLGDDTWADALAIIDELLPQRSSWARNYREKFMNK